MLNITSATSGGIIAVADEGKDVEKRDVSAKGGDAIEKRNKEGEKPLINYNGQRQLNTRRETRKTRKFGVINKGEWGRIVAAINGLLKAE